MISIKREQFHIQIRRKRNDLEFKKKRTTPLIITNQDSLNNLSPELIQQLTTNIEFNHQLPQKLDFLIPLLQPQNNNLKETFFLLSTVLHYSEVQQFEDFFEYSKLNEFLIEILKSAPEQDLDLLDILFELLAHLCQKSLLIQSSFVSSDLIVILQHILPNVDVCLNDYCCDSLLELINVFVNYESRIPLVRLKPLLPCLNEIAKKMRMINYIKPDLQQEDCELIDEQRWSVLYKLTTAIRGISELSNFQINFCEFKSLWIILLELTFEQQFNVKLRLYGLICLALISIGTSTAIINYQPDICFNLMMLLEIHRENEEKIRINSAIVLRNIFAIENENIVEMIHLCEIPQQFISLLKGEMSIKVIYQELECLFNILSYCKQEQAHKMVNQGLIQAIKIELEYVMNLKDWGCLKQFIKVIFALLKHNQRENGIAEQLKASQIQKYLEWMTTFEKKTLQERASKVLQYFELL